MLELVNTFDAEMSQLEVARRIYAQVLAPIMVSCLDVAINVGGRNSFLYTLKLNVILIQGAVRDQHSGMLGTFHIPLVMVFCSCYLGHSFPTQWVDYESG